MLKRKGFILLALLLIVSLVAVACGQGEESAPNEEQNQGETPSEGTEENTNETETQVLKVGATAVPHAEILEEVVAPLLEEQGISLEVTVFQDYILPNKNLFEGDLDANFFQHIPYLTSQNEEHNYGLVEVAGVHIEPMGGYSDRYDSIEDLPDGALILHPDAVSEEGRVLALLESKGLITLAEGVGFYGTVRDIVDNPHNFEFRGVEAATLAQAYVDGDLAIINTNYALQAGLSPAEDSLILEEPDNNPYVNVLAALEANQNDEGIQKLAEALNSPEVRDYILEKYEGNVIPAF
ncbi:MetQ/NlpA family ABC transporter substrate-binding protein [Bacillus horti]|uniref:Lipoprotein n=1 Tax=Caldalkalibacillus horti TaxID=77523 RepID=A0ABT9VTX7_9BACI|nr:MetQ/NlpA family ABC transporter substrate-binding protein [Bacillus horti]MDQ0164439.1 D-methionine transport system substrate-binding protein [Bacillus horti]